MIFGRIARHTGSSLALQEMLYGFIMALLFITAVRFDVLKFSTVEDLIILMVGMDFTWGAIDAVLFYMIDVMDQHRMEKILTSRKSPEAIAEILQYEFGGSPAGLLRQEGIRRVGLQVAVEPLKDKNGLKEDRRRMWISSVYCFLATVVTLLVVVPPLLLFDDASEALFASSVFSAIALFIIGYEYSGYVGINKVLGGIFITSVAWAIILVATFTGG